MATIKKACKGAIYPKSSSVSKRLGSPSKKMKSGGSLKPVDSSKNPGLAKLPTEVRNKMGYQKTGGKTTKSMKMGGKTKKCMTGCK
jgi:hypothetical protein